MDPKDLVDFVAKPGVTIYPAGSAMGYPAGTPVKMTQAEADALAHLAAEPEPIPEPAPAAPNPAPAPADVDPALDDHA
jgi:hypothetical protein